MADKIKTKVEHTDDTPPVLGSWNKIYALVLIVLILLIIFFYFFTKAFE